ncbi:MAG: hypothetical protein Q9209_000833 [Squamulea sp. 1 TL-2023]
MVLLSDTLDEIDWEFLGGVTTNVQTNYFGKGYTGTYNRSTSPAVASPQTQFHTYALDWSTAALTWSIDGVVVRTLNAKDADGNGDQYPQSPMKVSLSLWDAGDPDSPTQAWSGGVTPIPPPEPYTMYVKSVKIFNQNPAQQYQYTDKSGSWKSIKIINDVPFSSSSSVAPTQATTLSLGFTSAVSSSPLSQASAAASILSSRTATPVSAASTQLLSSTLSNSTQSAVLAASAKSKNSVSDANFLSAAASSTLNRVATADAPNSADSHPVITLSSTLTATITSCSSKWDCPTNSNQGTSTGTPAALMGSVSESTTHLTSTVTQGTHTYTSTLPSSAASSSSTTAAWTSSASVALSSKTMTLSPYPPSSTSSIKNLNQSPSVNASSASSYRSSSTATVISWFSSSSGSSPATVSTPKMTPIANVSSANLQQSISTGKIDSWSSSASSYGIGTASTKVSTIGSLSFTDLVPAASTATVTSVTTASCSDKSSQLGLTPPAAGSSKTTLWSLSSYRFSSSSIIPSGTAASNNWASSTSTWSSLSALPSSWALTQVPSGSSALVSTLATSPSIVLIPLSPILPSAKPSTSNPPPPQSTPIATSSSSQSWAKPPTTNTLPQHTSPALAPPALASTLATSPSTVLIPLSPVLKSQIASSSAAAATLDTKSVISVGSLTAWGFTSAPEVTTTSINTATISSTATASRPQLTPSPAPGYSTQKWINDHIEKAGVLSLKHPSATASISSKLVTSIGPKASSLVSPIGNENGTPTTTTTTTTTDEDIISTSENNDSETETDNPDNLGPQTTAPPWSGVGKTNWADDMNVPWAESDINGNNEEWNNAPESNSAWSSVTSVGVKVASTPKPSYSTANVTIAKPIIASTGGWTTPSGVAGTTGRTVAFKGEGGRVEMGTEILALVVGVVGLMVLM